MSIPLFFHSISYSMRYLYKTGTCKHHCHISGFLGPRHSLSQMELKHCVAARTVNPPHPHRRRRRQVHSRSLHSVAPSDALPSQSEEAERTKSEKRVVHKLTDRESDFDCDCIVEIFVCLFALLGPPPHPHARTPSPFPPFLHSTSSYFPNVCTAKIPLFLRRCPFYLSPLRGWAAIPRLSFVDLYLWGPTIAAKVICPFCLFKLLCHLHKRNWDISGTKQSKPNRVSTLLCRPVLRRRLRTLLVHNHGRARNNETAENSKSD